MDAKDVADKSAAAGVARAREEEQHGEVEDERKHEQHQEEKAAASNEGSEDPPSSHVAQAANNDLVQAPPSHPLMTSMASSTTTRTTTKEGSLQGHELRTTRTTPGAFAVRGTQADAISTENLEGYQQQPQQRAHEFVLSDDQESTVVMVEATPVQEIFATQVVLEQELVPIVHSSRSRVPPPDLEDYPRHHDHNHHNHHHQDNVTIQEVDIDNFDHVDDGTRNNITSSNVGGHHDRPTQPVDSASSGRPYEPKKVLLVILSILVGFVAIALLVYWPIIAQKDEIIDPTGDSHGDNPCVHAYQETVYALQRLKAKALVEFVLACAVNGFLLNQLIVGMKSRYFSKPGANPSSSPDGVRFYANLSSFCIELLWLFVGITMVIWINMENLVYPYKILEVACQLGHSDNDNDSNDDNNDVYTIVMNINTMSDLRGYFTACHVRLALLNCLLVSRGKLLFARKSWEHVRVVWKHVWMGFIWVLEVSLFVLSGTSLFMALLPTLDDMANFDPYLVRKQ